MVRLPFVWDVNSPLIDALHAYDVQIACKALADPEEPPAQKEETTMTTTHPQVRPSQLQTNVEAQARHLAQQGEQIHELQKLVERLMSIQGTETQAIADLDEKRQQQARQISELMELVDQVMTDQGALQAKVEGLNVRPPRRAPDDTNDRIVGYLRDSVPGVWLTPGSVAVNLDLEAKSTAGRLERMSRDLHPRIERKGGRGSGAHPLYRVVPPPKPAQPESGDGH